MNGLTNILKECKTKQNLIPKKETSSDINADIINLSDYPYYLDDKVSILGHTLILGCNNPFNTGYDNTSLLLYSMFNKYYKLSTTYRNEHPLSRGINSIIVLCKEKIIYSFNRDHYEEIKNENITIEDVYNVVKDVCDNMMKTFKLLEENQINNYIKFKDPDNKPTCLYIDNINLLFNNDNITHNYKYLDAIKSNISSISRLGRASGTRLVLSIDTNGANEDALTFIKSLKDNCSIVELDSNMPQIEADYFNKPINCDIHSNYGIAKSILDKNDTCHAFYLGNAEEFINTKNNLNVEEKHEL